MLRIRDGDRHGTPRTRGISNEIYRNFVMARNAITGIDGFINEDVELDALDASFLPLMVQVIISVDETSSRETLKITFNSLWKFGLSFQEIGKEGQYGSVFLKIQPAMRHMGRLWAIKGKTEYEDLKVKWKGLSGTFDMVSWL